MESDRYLIKRTLVATEKNIEPVREKIQWHGSWEKGDEFTDVNALPPWYILNYAYKGKAAAMAGLRSMKRRGKGGISLKRLSEPGL